MRIPLSSSSQWCVAVVLSCVVGGGVACHDVTAPVRGATRPLAESPAASVSVAPSAPIVVWPDSVRDWRFEQEPDDQSCRVSLQCRFVAGPASPPLGQGSAELAAHGGRETRLTLHAFGGTRLDRLTSLGYSAYRQSADPKNDAAVTLRLTVQYDAATGDDDIGHLVYEPSLAAPGQVAQGKWRSWSALDGLWWSDREARHADHGARAHPCLRRRPCTWPMVLARFPRIALHPGEGALSLGTPRGNFRGNVDSVAIGIEGRVTVFDFELERRRERYVLASAVGDGVIVDRFPSDTLFAEGTAVPYAFSARPGRTAPLVILDDTLMMEPAGTILMNARHRVAVVSDTIYSYASLTPLEKSIADLTHTLLTSAEKVGAAQAINSFLVDQVNSGVSPELVARATAVAQHVMVDPVRDAAALNEIDAALSGQSFHYQYAGYNGPGRMTTWTSRDWPTMPTSNKMGVPVAPVGTSQPLTEPGHAMSSTSRSMREQVTDSDPENPQEATRVLFANGIWTQYDDAFSSAILLASLVYAEPRFHNYRTGVTLYYNPTRTAQMAAWDAANPCEAQFHWNMSWTSAAYALYKLSLCKRINFATVVMSVDIVEAITARVQMDLHWAPTNDAVRGMAATIAAYRAGQVHAMLVGHSEGVILQAQAVQQLPLLEQHPLETASRCVAILALAPPMRRTQYAMDDHYLIGLLAQLDIIRLTLSTGWEDVETPLTRAVADSATLLHPLHYLQMMSRIHGLVETYLTGGVASLVRARLATLHRECIPGSANLSLSSSVVPIQQSVSAALAIYNQNNRQLFGRKYGMGRYGYFFDRTDSMTFRSMAPSERPVFISAVVTPSLVVSAQVQIPLVRPDFAIRETLLWEWVAVAAGNGPNGTGSDVPVPTDKWDGSPGSCGRQIKNFGAAGNFVTYELRCNRAYTPVFVRPDTLPTGRRIVGATVFFTNPQGVTSVAPPTYYYCPGATPCIASGYMEWNGELGVVARSGVVFPVIASSMSGGTLASVNASSRALP